MEQANMENQGVRLGDGPSETETRAISGVPPEGVGVRNRCGLGRRCLGLEHSRAIDSRITRKQDYYASLYSASFLGWRAPAGSGCLIDVAWDEDVWAVSTPVPLTVA